MEIGLAGELIINCLDCGAEYIIDIDYLDEVAVVMALDRAIRCGNDTSESVYNSRGILFL